MPSATVRPISRDRYMIVPAPGITIVVFRNHDGSADAMVMNKDRTETTRLRIEPPEAGRELAIVRNEDGAIEVIYHNGVNK